MNDELIRNEDRSAIREVRDPLEIHVNRDRMRATLVRRAFNRPGWTFEHKLDGFRALARREGDRVDLPSRTGRP